MIYLDVPFESLVFELVEHEPRCPVDEVSAHWSALCAKNPALFDGEVLACCAMRFERGRTVFSLCRTPYSRYAWARGHDRPIAGAWAVGTGVIVWDESEEAFAFFERADTVLFDRGRVSGVGGVLEWSADAGPDFRRHLEESVLHELREEIGVSLRRADLSPLGLWVDERTLKLELLHLARVEACRIANAENVRVVHVAAGGLAAFVAERGEALETSMREHLLRVAPLLDATFDRRAKSAAPRASIDRVASVDLLAVHARIGASVERAALRVLRSGRYVLGPEVDAFEEEIAAYCGVKHAVSCGSGTDALVLALLALGVGRDHEVLVPAFTFFVDAEVVSRIGAVPRFVDVEPMSLTVDPDRVEAAIGPRTRALIVTHLYGMTADMTALRAIASRRGVALIEDACQALGTRHRGVRAGGLGDVGCFSFFPTKNLGAYGDGGALTTDDARLAALARKLRNHGAAEKYAHDCIGLNSRLDALQAAMLRAKLPHLEGWNRRRAEIAMRYDEVLRALGRTPAFVPPHCEPNWHLYTIRANDRGALRAHLASSGVETAIHYPRAPFAYAPYASQTDARDFPVASAAAREVLCLPMHAELRDADVDRVVTALRSAPR